MQQPGRFITHFIVSVAGLIASGAAAAGDTLDVPFEYPTIQAAIDAAVDSDIILVYPGTYAEAIDLGEKNIALIGFGAEVTTIDAAGLDASTVALSPSKSASIQGFTIRGGSGTVIQLAAATKIPVGGGVFVQSGHALVGDCILTQNVANLGGGIYLASDAHAAINEAHITSNQSTAGGGVFSNGGMPVLTATTIQGNHADNGAGMFLVGSGEAHGCLFIDNAAANDGGGLLIAGGDGTISNCSFQNNTAPGRGGAIHAVEGGRIVIGDSSFLHNAAATGGAVSIGSSGSATITGSDFCSNAPTSINGDWRNGGGNTFGPFCPIGDLDGNESVTVFDLLALLGAWGDCADGASCVPDFNADGTVDVLDLLILLAAWS